jgi:hypothetical protein
MKTLAIIGTAGRGEDAYKLKCNPHWVAMLADASRLVEREGFGRFVSGGAAWADHVAVSLALAGCGKYSLGLHLPGIAGDMETAIKYHRRFSHALHWNTLGQLAEVQGELYCRTTRKGSFKDRNGRVAGEADSFLAMTFGNCGRVKDGGTAHTVRLMQGQGKTGWHFDLNRLELFEAEKII